MIFFFFLYDSCLIMMIAADPGGVERADPSLHYSTPMQPTRLESRVEWRGALEALNPPPSWLTSGRFLSSPKTLLEYTLGLTNYS